VKKEDLLQKVVIVSNEMSDFRPKIISHVMVSSDPQITSHSKSNGSNHDSLRDPRTASRRVICDMKNEMRCFRIGLAFGSAFFGRYINTHCIFGTFSNIVPMSVFDRLSLNGYTQNLDCEVYIYQYDHNRHERFVNRWGN
jgi:hypothetical protein